MAAKARQRNFAVGNLCQLSHYRYLSMEKTPLLPHAEIGPPLLRSNLDRQGPLESLYQTSYHSAVRTPPLSVLHSDLNHQASCRTLHPTKAPCCHARGTTLTSLARVTSGRASA